MPKNVENLGKLIVAKGFKKLPKFNISPNLVTLIECDQLLWKNYPAKLLAKNSTVNN